MSAEELAGRDLVPFGAAVGAVMTSRRGLYGRTPTALAALAEVIVATPPGQAGLAIRVEGAPDGPDDADTGMLVTWAQRKQSLTWGSMSSAGAVSRFRSACSRPILHRWRVAEQGTVGTGTHR